MLLELSAENIAIMDRVDVRFGPGFTSITGETGAGKSLLIDAISLCLGERADTSLVRKGAASATVRAVFDPPEHTRALLREMGYEIGDEFLFLQRDLAAEGKSSCRINGRTSPLSVLKQVGDTLADLHGQHEHQSLLNVSSHLGLLDVWIGVDALSVRALVSESWETILHLQKELGELRRDSAERERMLDVLRFQVQELDGAGVRVGEIEELQGEIKRLQGAEALEGYLKVAEESLYSSDRSARDLIQNALKSLDEVGAIDPRLQPAIDALRNAELAVEEAAKEIKQGLDRVEFDPERIENIAARLDEYATLRRKYGETEEIILEFLNKANFDLGRLENAEALRNDIDSKLGEARNEYEMRAASLTEVREAFAEKFASLVLAELQELGMLGGKFACVLSAGHAGPYGKDSFEFQFSANVGEDVRPLSKIASGGEMSRVMLAIKTVMAGKGGVPTLIFDEIDAGLGGQTAAVVAKKLARLGESYQVLAITHVPQIAGRAGAQVSIEKSTSAGRTVMAVRELSASERVEEIARMVGGETVGEEAIANARQLLS
ncbi:MAG: DNA repair protein RecN [Armatimonadota bacterium]|nr:DNA repair protein RecN [Armatimonadota bacterium]